MVDYLKTILGRAVLAAALGAPVGAVAQVPVPDQGQPAEESDSGQQDAAPAGTATADPAVTQPAGLESFLKARLLESDGRYREALDAYAQALKESPSGVEIRVRYASLLTQVGLVDTAVKTLDEVAEDELDSFGLRTRALALAQMATRRPEMVGKAEAALRAALEERPDDPNLQLSLAQIAHRQGRVEEAEAIIVGMRGQHGSNLRLLAYHASLLRSLGRSEDAAELYARCAEERFGECRDSLVELLVELGRPGEAGEALLSWLDDDDLDGMLRAAGLLSSGGRPAEALRVVRRVLEAEPESRRARSLEALLLASMGDHEQAALRFEKLLRKDPDNLELTLTFAWTQMRRGRLEDARKLVARAWETVRDPTSPEGVNCAVTAARIELATGHPLVAREWLERIRGATSTGADVVRLLAASYRDVEHWREGMSAMLRLQPQLPAGARAEALAYEAEFRLRLGDAQGVQRLQPLLQSDEIGEVLVALQVLQLTERWADVEREATAALVQFPDDRNLRFTLAAALERLDRFEEAEAVFSLLAEDEPEDAATANYLGYMWADRGVKLDEALHLINRAVAADPDNPAYLDSLGWVHFRLGNLDEAEQWLRKAVATSQSDGDGTIMSHLGEVLLARDQYDEARRYLLRALDLGCEQPQHVRDLLDRLGD